LIIITNQSLQQCRGQLDGFELLVNSGELEFVDRVAYRGDGPVPSRFDFVNVHEALSKSRATHAMIWSPGRFPESIEQFENLNQALRSRPLIYWEGDAWGRGKPITSQMKLWLNRADAVFSVAGHPQTELLGAETSTEIRRTFHTYCHVRFADFETLRDRETSRTASLIGGMVMRIPMPAFTGLPGSWDRLKLGWTLKRELSTDIAIFGKGWPLGLSDGHLDFDQQVQEIQNGKVSVNWDHFPDYHGYFSDRLPISLLAGRPHITSLHPDMEWAPGAADGLFQERSVKDARNRTLEMTTVDPVVVRRQGRALHSWVVNRLSHRQFARHLASGAIDSISPVNLEPWSTVT
jgi:hypothetical protein